ncbi:hypothetical protein VIBR0546_12912 [Vibrio brasiliensis LMG 20546]|uniref:Uncharacterized protein n=1 Tax=Vibrio brasiliensis LMG 20546 TaxID=945543 RepID=E8LP77_9VIBR|nr:hypothetical protein VIBR0546_12912 [Vibrio brasiliensis LMG 20546]
MYCPTVEPSTRLEGSIDSLAQSQIMINYDGD